MAAPTTWDPGRELHMARRDAGVGQQELADHLGVSRPLISKWERNKSEPTITQWRRIVQFFEARGVSTVALTHSTCDIADVAA